MSWQPARPAVEALDFAVDLGLIEGGADVLGLELRERSLEVAGVVIAEVVVSWQPLDLWDAKTELQDLPWTAQARATSAIDPSAPIGSRLCTRSLSPPCASVLRLAR